MSIKEPNEEKGCAWIIFAFWAGIALCILASRM